MKLYPRLHLRGWGRLLPVLFVALALTLAVAPSRAQAPQDAVATVTAGRAPVWAGPGEGFWWIGFVFRDEIVPVLGISADHQWWQVKTRDGVGWLSAQDVTTSTTDVPVADPGMIGTITAGRVIVHTGPGIGAPGFGSASRGLQFFVLKTQPDGSWIQIKYRFGTGWVAASVTSLAGGAVLTDNIPATAGPRAIVNTGALNVRTGPGFGFAPLGVLRGGDEVPIIGRTTDGTWIQVKSPFGDGWINIIYVITKDYFGSAPITESQAANAPREATFVVLTGTVNVRRGPNVSFPALLTVNAGMHLPILGQSRDRGWWLVKVGDQQGWVNKQLGQAIGSVNTVPVTEVTE